MLWRRGGKRGRGEIGKHEKTFLMGTCAGTLKMELFLHTMSDINVCAPKIHWTPIDFPNIEQHEEHVQIQSAGLL